MPKLSINTGVLLIILGFFSFIASEMASYTALIPSLFGIVFTGLGLIARKMESMRKHTMRAALLLAVLGAGGTFPGLKVIAIALMGGKVPVQFTAASSQAVMAVICIIFILLGIKSLMDASKRSDSSG